MNTDIEMPRITQNAVKVLPVEWLEFMPVHRVAVDEEGVALMLGLRSRSVRGRKAAVYRFRKRNRIEPVPGTTVFSVKAIQRAVSGGNAK